MFANVSNIQDPSSIQVCVILSSRMWWSKDMWYCARRFKNLQPSSILMEIRRNVHTKIYAKLGFVLGSLELNTCNVVTLVTLGHFLIPKKVFEVPITLASFVFSFFQSPGCKIHQKWKHWCQPVIFLVENFHSFGIFGGNIFEVKACFSI